MEYNFDSLTEEQQKTLGRIAINMPPFAHPRTLLRLEERGMIVAEERVLPGRFPVKVREYWVPQDVHIQWCAWCARNEPV